MALQKKFQSNTRIAFQKAARLNVRRNKNAEVHQSNLNAHSLTNEEQAPNLWQNCAHIFGIESKD